MIYQTQKLAPGLYFVATPLGAARDITLRALDILASADLLVAEDTRALRKLMEIHGIPLGSRPIWSYHDHSGDGARDGILRAAQEGQVVAYASEAGTPLIADPGYELVSAARAQDILVIAAPGPSAVVTALTVAGLPTDRFLFLGFTPSNSTGRRKVLEEVKQTQASLVFYESPKRVGAFFTDAAQVLGGARRAVLCRELTKKFEEVNAGTLEALAAHYAETGPRGECVIVIDRADSPIVHLEDLESDLRSLMQTHKVKDAAAMLSEAHGLSKRDIYQFALSLRDT